MIEENVDTKIVDVTTCENDRQMLDRSLYGAAQCLKAGGLVAFPTETVYGLGADAL